MGRHRRKERPIVAIPVMPQQRSKPLDYRLLHRAFERVPESLFLEAKRKRDGGRLDVRLSMLLQPQNLVCALGSLKGERRSAALFKCDLISLWGAQCRDAHRLEKEASSEGF